MGKSSGVGMFSLVATIIFIASILSLAGVFGYNIYLKKDLQKKDMQLQETRKHIKPELIEELVRLDKRIKTAGSILSGHASVSSLFKKLEEDTLVTIRFTSFKFTTDKDGKNKILTMAGLGRSYNSLALQSDIFRAEKYLKNPIFSELELDDSGGIAFEVKMEIDNELVLYNSRLAKTLEEGDLALPEETATTTDATDSSDLSDTDGGETEI